VALSGYLAAFRGRRGEAEKLYRQALAKQASFLPVRHNLALLLSETGREDEGVALWQAILNDDPQS
jgi:Flp pilus assembly protein TadD